MDWQRPLDLAAARAARDAAPLRFVANIVRLADRSMLESQYPVVDSFVNSIWLHTWKREGAWASNRSRQFELATSSSYFRCHCSRERPGSSCANAVSLKPGARLAGCCSRLRPCSVRRPLHSPGITRYGIGESSKANTSRLRCCGLPMPSCLPFDPGHRASTRVQKIHRATFHRAIALHDRQSCAARVLEDAAWAGAQTTNRSLRRLT